MSTVDYNVGKCTWRYAMVNGVKTDIADAQRGSKGICPLCGEELLPRMGNIRTWHWYHVHGRACDEWYEPKGPWHQAWQAQFDREWQEVPVVKTVGEEEKRHIADVKTPNGWTIEFQYSYLPVESVKEREDFYGHIVWVVSGTRLEKDLSCGRDLMNHHRESFKSTDGIRYFVDRPSALPDNPFGDNREKFVFFDFEGDFSNPQTEGTLLCVLPRDIRGYRVIAMVAKASLIESFRKGEEREFLIRIWACSKEFSKRLRYDEEARKRKKKDEEQRRKRYLEQPKIAQYAITFGWLQAYMLAKGRIKYFTLKSVPNCYDLKGREGLIAIHCMSNYTKDQYLRDIEGLKADRCMCDKWKISEEEIFPDYDKLKVVQGAIVGRARYRRFNDGGYIKLVVDRFERFRKPKGTKRIVLNDSNLDEVWPLPGEVVIAVDNLAKSVGGVSSAKYYDVESLGEKSYIYTGKGYFYRESKSYWLHKLRDGKMVPLKSEHQNWDS